MSTVQQAPIAPASVASDLTLGDLRAALAAGWGDFKAHPMFGLFFSAVFAITGRTRTENDLTMWRVARGAAGRLPPTGFPKSGKFD